MGLIDGEEKLQDEKTAFKLSRDIGELYEFLDFIKRSLDCNKQLFLNSDWKGLVDNLKQVKFDVISMRIAIDMIIEVLEEVKIEGE